MVMDHNKRSSADADKVSFRGNLQNKSGLSIFSFTRDNKVLKPVLLMSGNLFRMYTFLQVERNSS